MVTHFLTTFYARARMGGYTKYLSPSVTIFKPLLRNARTGNVLAFYRREADAGRVPLWELKSGNYPNVRSPETVVTLLEISK